MASDVVVCDIEKHTILSSPVIFSKESFETFPTFSPDGQKLYYCSAPAMPMPDSICNLKYSLCSVSFNPENGMFGNKVDTLFNASVKGQSVSFPRVSPDGHFLLCTLSDYGTFPIWHKEADLYMINLQIGMGIIQKPQTVMILKVTIPGRQIVVGLCLAVVVWMVFIRVLSLSM